MRAGPPRPRLRRAPPRVAPRPLPPRRPGGRAGGSAGRDRDRPSRTTSDGYELELEGPLADLTPPPRWVGRSQLLLAAERAVERDGAWRHGAHRPASGVANAVSSASSRPRTNSVKLGPFAARRAW